VLKIHATKIPAYGLKKAYLSLGFASSRGMVPTLDTKMVCYTSLNAGYSWRDSYAKASGWTLGITSGVAF